MLLAPTLGFVHFTDLIGLVLFGVGAIIAIFNFYLSFLRYPVHRLLGAPRETYRWSSGIPLFGSLFLWLSLPLLHPRWGLIWSAIGISLLDTAGLHWFVGVMVWHGLRRGIDEPDKPEH